MLAGFFRFLILVVSLISVILGGATRIYGTSNNYGPYSQEMIYGGLILGLIAIILMKIKAVRTRNAEAILD